MPGTLLAPYERGHREERTENMNDSIKYDVPDVEPDERTGLSTWPVYVNGARIGEITETLEGYRASAPLWHGKELPFRQSAIESLRRHFEGAE